MVLRPVPSVLAVVALCGLAGCGSGSSTAGRKSQRATTTTSRRHRGSTTTTSSRTTNTTTTTTTAPSSATTTATSPPSSIPSATSGNCGARADAINAAVQGGDLATVPLDKYTITNCRVSTTNPIWSAVTLVPMAGSGLAQLTVALERVGATWQVRQYGLDHVACSAPPPVPTELQLGC